MARRRKRQQTNYISVRLGAGDADLADWWENLPQGIGGETVKRALRQYILSASDSQAASSFEVRTQMDEIKRAVAIVAQQVAKVDERIRTGIVVNGSSAVNVPGQMTFDEEQERKRNILKARW